MLRSRFVELCERHAGLHDRDLVLGVDLDALHALERHDDSTGGRDRRAGQPGTAASRGDSDAVLIAEVKDRGDLARSLWQQHGHWDDRRRTERLVVGVVVARIAGQDAVGGQDAVELSVIHRAQSYANWRPCGLLVFFFESCSALIQPIETTQRIDWRSPG